MSDQEDKVNPSRPTRKRGQGHEWHLDRDPNDPRRNVPATPNLSNLNEEDPEKKPQPQNPVE
jgi:hypothetical protein